MDPNKSLIEFYTCFKSLFLQFRLKCFIEGKDKVIITIKTKAAFITLNVNKKHPIWETMI